MSALVGVLLTLVLVASGTTHLRAPATTAAQLRAHDVVPVNPAVVIALACAELGLAGWLVSAVLARSAPAPALVLAGAFFLGCAGYLALVRAQGGAGLPCGCGLGDGGVGGWSITRAATLGVVGLAVGVLDLGGIAQAPTGATQWAIAVVAAATLALIAAVLPAARPAPEVSR